ncbi:MAG: TIGR03013 family PEP-CTERM/XrtA system glycosyltransferase [Desulfobacterales bacterium]|nr:TIGR03013 family PEP-CTERM/XrtA system glycosyltransferase [Desulfobacterales bacterium]
MFHIQTVIGSLTIILADLLIIYAGFWSVLSLLSGFSAGLRAVLQHPHLFLSAFTLITLLALPVARLYSFREYILPLELIRRTVCSFLVAIGSIATLVFFVQSMAVIHWHLIPTLSVIFVCLFFFRYHLFYGMHQNREKILILGATEQARKIIQATGLKKTRAYNVIGIITTLDGQVGRTFEGIPILGLVGQMEEILAVHDANSIIVTLRDRRGKLPVRELLEAKVAHIRIQEGSAFYEKIKKKTNIDEFLKPSWFIFEDGFYHTSLTGFVKRIQGIIVSVILLTVLSPVILIVIILIKIDTPGPVFFVQERVGLHGNTFRLIKFRSMRVDAELMSGPKFAEKKDPRITRVGGIIRKLRLDEIPQFINIFKGDMDMVGPRPERPVFVRQLEAHVPYYNLRHTVRPGLTGWAQVNYPYGENIEDGREKLQYDLYYVKHFSWYLDVLIIFLTIKTVLFGKGQ